MIVDGRALAREVLARAKARAERLQRRPKVVAYAIAPTPATRSYLKIKERSAAEAGCDFEARDIKISGRPSQHFDMSADAIIVQLPLPPELDTKAILDSILVEKDADVLSSAARAAFESRDIVSPYILPPVVGAIFEIFQRFNIEIEGKRAVVIGAGFLVGAPAAVWLRQQGANIEVMETPADFETQARTVLAQADIIFSGAGSPHLIKPDMIKEGVVLIDAGTSESSGKIVGDADPACAHMCSVFTPVPGGVGPLAVAKLFENVVALAEKAMNT